MLGPVVLVIGVLAALVGLGVVGIAVGSLAHMIVAKYGIWVSVSGAVLALPVVVLIVFIGVALVND